MASENTVLDASEEQTAQQPQDADQVPLEYDTSTEAMKRVLACLRAD